MKSLLLSALCLVFGSNLPAQESSATIFNGAGSFTRAYGLQPDLVDGMHRVSGLKFNTGKRVEGSAFFNEDFHTGYIVFFNDKKVEQVPLKYNDLNDELYFDDNGREMILQTSFREFGFTITNDDQRRDIVFRNGFPATDEHTDKTFYQVLAGSRLLLLKRTNKKVQEAKELNGMEFLRIKAAEAYYAFDPATRKITRVKAGLDNITEVLPDWRQAISGKAKSLGLKCKSEKELILLFSQL